MRQVQEMAVEFVNALNAAAAAESECAKLRRLLEEERKLVQRLKQEKEDEAQMAKRKIDRMSQRLAEAQKDVEYATTRADVAENEWVRLKRELQESQDLVQLLKPENEERRQDVLRQVDDKELELANALNAASITESECDNLRTMLEEERKLVQRLILEKDDEAQLAKRQIEEISQELADARKCAEYAATRADVAETEWIKAKKKLQELSQLLKSECDEMRQSAMRQVEEKERELVDALHASEIAECERAKLKRMLGEEQRLRLENDDEVQLAKRQIEEMDQELANARNDAEIAQKDADAAENESAELKRMLEEEQRLRLEKDDEVQLAKMQIEEMDRELANAQKEAELARKDADAAENEWAKLKRMLEEEQRLRLENEDEAQLAKRQIEEMGQELANAQKDAELAQKDADAAENEWAELKRMLEEDRKLIEEMDQELSTARKDAELARKDADAAENEWAELKRMLEKDRKLIEEMDQELANAGKDADLARKDADAAENEWAKVKRDLKNMELRCQEIRESASRQDEEKALELANARNAYAIAESECAKLKRMLIEEGKTVQRLIIEKDDEAEVAKRQIEKMGQELASARKEAQLARKEAQFARKDSDIAENEWTKVKRELKEKEELVKLLKLEILEMRQITMRQVEEISHKLEDARKEAEHAHKEAEHARQEADIAQNEWVKTRKELQKKLEIVRLLKIECQETRESAMRQVEEKEKELADALNAVTAASLSSAAAQDCVICLTNEKDMAFGCGHMTCEECGMMLSTCHICREEITCRIKLFPG